MLQIALVFLNEVLVSDAWWIVPLNRAIYPTEVDSLSPLVRVIETLVSSVALGQNIADARSRTSIRE
jgi:hypothetical protein